jgi:hypothetical protein
MAAARRGGPWPLALRALDRLRFARWGFRGLGLQGSPGREEAALAEGACALAQIGARERHNSRLSRHYLSH